MISKNQTEINVIHNIKMDKPKNNWNTHAEQKRVIAPKEIYKAVLRNGLDYLPTNAQYGDGGNLYEELSESAKRLRLEQLTAQTKKEVVSMGDIKDKEESPTVSKQETVGKDKAEENK